MKKHIIICGLLLISLVSFLTSCSDSKNLKRVNKVEDKPTYEKTEKKEYPKQTENKKKEEPEKTTENKKKEEKTTSKETENVPTSTTFDYDRLNSEYTDTKFFKNVLYQQDFESITEDEMEGENFVLSSNTIYEKFVSDKTRAPNILEDKYKTVLELSSKKPDQSTYSFIVDLPTNAHLSCDVFSDVYEENAFQIIVDNMVYSFTNVGKAKAWINCNLDIRKGKHKITFKVPFNKYYYKENHLNAVYVDNILIVKDEIAFLEIEPKGLQETFENGDPIYFTAVALRGDRSIMKDVDVSYSVSGGGTIDSTGKFMPTKQGLCTITAKAGGLTATKNNVYVHQNNFLLDPVQIGDYSITGKVTDLIGEPLSKDFLTYYYPTPKLDTFSADGFFVIEADTTKPLGIYVTKNAEDNTDFYYIREPGFFYKRIWLRYGPGDYTIYFCDTSNIKMYEGKNGKKDADIFDLGDMEIFQALYVNNTNKLSKEDAMVLLPSATVNSDDLFISNFAHSIVSSLPKDASQGEIIQSVNNWIVNNLVYDPDFVEGGNYRLRQDSRYVYLNRIGVCVGYRNLCAAVLRKIGIKTKNIDSDDLNHAWNHVLYNGKWYLLDTTWNDPKVIDETTEHSQQYRETYTYFMTGHTDQKHTDAGKQVNS